MKVGVQHERVRSCCAQDGDHEGAVYRTQGPSQATQRWLGHEMASVGLVYGTPGPVELLQKERFAGC